MNQKHLDEKSKEQLIDRYILAVRTKDRAKFEDTTMKGILQFDEETIVQILNQIPQKLKICGGYETFVEFLECEK
tara:strand:+ start:180 stop:404 length:225 start_codon:yes stop_codon:yes gene_type:complete